MRYPQPTFLTGREFFFFLRKNDRCSNIGLLMIVPSKLLLKTTQISDVSQPRNMRQTSDKFPAVKATASIATYDSCVMF
jgi:hypothetical protein